MCIVHKKTYIQPDGSEYISEDARRCHQAVGNSYCRNVRIEESRAHVVMVERPQSRGGSQSDELVTIDKYGREHRYRTFPRTRSTRQPDRGPVTVEQSPVDIGPSPSSPFEPTYREFKPTAPMPPKTTKLPSARYSSPTSPTSPPNPNKRISRQNTADYDYPPPLPTSQPSQYNRPSSRKGEVENPFTPLTRRPSTARRPAPKPTITHAVDSFGGSSSGSSSLPGLSSSPGISISRRDSMTTSHRPRADSTIAQDEKLARQMQEAEAYQSDDAQKLRNVLAENAQRRTSFLDQEEQDRRRRLNEADELDRHRRSRLAAEGEALKIAAKNKPEAGEASRDRKEQKRYESEDILDGKRARREEDLEFERVQQARERHEKQVRDSGEQLMSPYGANIFGSSPTLSNKSPISPRPGAVVHQYHYPQNRNSLHQWGENVMQGQRAAAAAAEADLVAEQVAGMYLSAEREEDDMQNFDAEMKASASQQLRRENRELRRREKEKDKRMKDKNFF